MSFDMIVMGSASMDVLVKADASVVHIQGTSHGHAVDDQLLAFPLGSKVLIRQIGFYPGGAGINTCATFAALGFNTAFLGMLGEDLHGQILLDWLAGNRIAFLGRRRGVTGYSLILASPADDRTILSFKGCNNDFEFTAFPPQRLQARWIYGTSMLDNSFTAQERLFRYARRRGMGTVYSPNPHVCSRGLGYLQTMLAHTEVCILNKEEAELLAGPGEPAALAEKLLDCGPRLVAVTAGAAGAVVVAGSAWGGERWQIRPVAAVEVVDTTGAGDAFGAGLVAGLSLNKPLREAALMGVLNAESVIRIYGAQPPAADCAAMERRLRAEGERPGHEVVRL